MSYIQKLRDELRILLAKENIYNSILAKLENIGKKDMDIEWIDFLTIYKENPVINDNLSLDELWNIWQEEKETLTKKD